MLSSKVHEIHLYFSIRHRGKVSSIEHIVLQVSFLVELLQLFNREVILTTYILSILATLTFIFCILTLELKALFPIHFFSLLYLVDKTYYFIMENCIFRKLEN